MLNTYWNKNTLDAGWANFARMLEYKAVTSDSTLIKVDPANTSKTCSKCGTINEALTIADRQFTCPSCGFSAHRDLNASHNILTVGTDSAKHNACGNTIRPSVKASVNETGTTHGK
jgi:putative transposase